jgi:hypothetical protein
MWLGAASLFLAVATLYREIPTQVISVSAQLSLLALLIYSVAYFRPHLNSRVSHGFLTAFLIAACGLVDKLLVISTFI